MQVKFYTYLRDSAGQKSEDKMAKRLLKQTSSTLLKAQAFSMQSKDFLFERVLDFLRLHGIAHC